MKNILRFVALSLVFPTVASASDINYPSLPSRVLSAYTPHAPKAHTPVLMAERGQAFLAALDENLRKQAVLPFDSPEKTRWTNVPPRGPQGGVRLGDLNEEQLKRVCDLLAAVLSPQGWQKMRNIPLADDRLLPNGRRRPGFGAEDYWLAIFGNPSAKGPWALQFDGHHLAVNLAFRGDRMAMSPTFIGTQPRVFKLGAASIEPLMNKDEAALVLLRCLSDAQQEEATVGNRRVNLVAAAGKDGAVPEPLGVSSKDFDEKQRQALLAVVRCYVGDLPEPYAARRLEELRAEADRMTFAWWGPAEEDGDFSYRIQGPTLIIEYAGQDLGGNPHNHLHSMYRDPTNEYGARLGKE